MCRARPTRPSNRRRGDLAGRVALCITLPDGLRIDGGQVPPALSRALGDAFVPVLGGTAGDHWQFEESIQLCNGTVHRASIPVLLFEGEVLAGYAVDSGWAAFGDTMIATECDGREVVAINGIPALDLYIQEFGDTVLTSFAEYPLALMTEDGNDARALRAIMAVNKERRSLVLAASMKDGQRVRFTHVERAGILGSSEHATTQALARYPGTDPAGVLVFSCAARKFLLGVQVPRDVDHLCAPVDSLKGVPVAGFYGFRRDRAGERTIRVPQRDLRRGSCWV